MIASHREVRQIIASHRGVRWMRARYRGVRWMGARYREVRPIIARYREVRHMIARYGWVRQMITMEKWDGGEQERENKTEESRTEESNVKSISKRCNSLLHIIRIRRYFVELNGQRSKWRNKKRSSTRQCTITCTIQHFHEWPTSTQEHAEFYLRRWLVYCDTGCISWEDRVNPQWRIRYHWRILWYKPPACQPRKDTDMRIPYPRQRSQPKAEHLVVRQRNLSTLQPQHTLELLLTEHLDTVLTSQRSKRRLQLKQCPKEAS